MNKNKKIIRDYKNAFDYVRHEIAYKIGLNVRIQSSKNVKKNTIEIKLKCIIPHKIILTNGHSYDGVLTVKDLDSFIIEEKKNGVVVRKKPDFFQLDKKLRTAILKFNDTEIADIRWSGA